MGLSDLFTPEWQHSNAEKRKSAIEAIDDKEILAKVVSVEPESSLVVLAIKKLLPQTEMKQKLELIIRLAALGIEGIEVLIQIINNEATDVELRNKAIEAVAMSHLVSSDNAKAKSIINNAIRSCSQENLFALGKKLEDMKLFNISIIVYEALKEQLWNRSDISLMIKEQLRSSLSRCYFSVGDMAKFQKNAMESFQISISPKPRNLFSNSDFNPLGHRSPRDRPFGSLFQ